MRKEREKTMIRQGCALILASLALSLDLPYDADSLRGPADGWGVDMTVMILGLAVIFYIAGERRRQKQTRLNIACGLFALSTVVGRCYMKSGNCCVLFSGGAQICAALLVTVGFYLLYQNVLLFLGWLIEWLKERMPFLFRRELGGGIEKWLFESHPMLGIVPVILILALPWLICFFPGSIETDACEQLCMVRGLGELTAHHSVIVAKLMGKVLWIGQVIFGVDFMGIFLYTFSQLVVQSFAAAYVIYVMGRLRTPVLLRWGTLAFYGLYPVFPMWGFTLVKDSGYYILVLLLVTTIADMLCSGETGPKWYQSVLLFASALGMCIYRKEGLGVVAVTLIYGIVVHKNLRKIFAGVLALCLIASVFIDQVYYKIEGVRESPIREALSIPLQQTARYARDHYEEITPEELEVLQEIFETDIVELADIYNPELADPVKDKFAPYPDDQALKAYFTVWWQQFLKHPGTYVEAFLHHMYGYICPDKMVSWAGEDIGVFHMFTEGLDVDVGYVIKDSGSRHFLERYSRNVKRLPVVGMIYSPGVHAWILLGCVLYLTGRRKWKELMIYIPGCCIWFVCILSPVNTCTRYTLPLIALLPLHLLWVAVSSGKEKQEYSLFV